MNVMLASGGYPWTVIPVDVRDVYLDSLEEASVRHNIAPFAKLIGRLVNQSMRKSSERTTRKGRRMKAEG